MCLWIFSTSAIMSLLLDVITFTCVTVFICTNQLLVWNISHFSLFLHICLDPVLIQYRGVHFPCVYEHDVTKFFNVAQKKPQKTKNTAYLPILDSHKLLHKPLSFQQEFSVLQIWVPLAFFSEDDFVSDLGKPQYLHLGVKAQQGRMNSALSWKQWTDRWLISWDSQILSKS